jgi:nicotinamidase-related amidase
VTEPSSSNIDAHLSRSPELLDCQRSHLLIVDVQKKLLPVIQDFVALEAAIVFLMNAAKVLQVPVFVSEQYPKGLGSTVPAIADHVVQKQVAEKLRFSAADCFLNERVNSQQPATEGQRDQVVVVGIEAHICVLQTAFDLLAQGLRVYVVADAVGSRSVPDYQTALHRIRDAGGIVCCAESVVFEWCEVAGTDEFRQISRLVRERDISRTAE